MDIMNLFFLNDLTIQGLSENAVRQAVKRLVANGFLERYDNGIYYIPKRDGLLGKSYLDPSLVIMRKYIQSKSEIYGYVTGRIICQSVRINNADASGD